MKLLKSAVAQNGHHYIETQDEEPTIWIGDDADGPVGIPLSVFSWTGLHALGSSGSGKSRLLTQINRQLLAMGPNAAFCQIDIEGPMHDSTMDFLAQPEHQRLAEHVVEFNLSDPGGDLWCGFNPLSRFDYSPKISVQVEHLLSSFAAVWGENSMQTPLLRRMLRDILTPLVEAGQTLMDADVFLTTGKSVARQRLVAMSNNGRVRLDWANFEGLSSSRQLEQLGSVSNRLAEFIDNQVLQLIMRKNNILDIKSLIDERKTLLVNLSEEGGWLSQSGAYLVASLLLTSFVSFALTRSEADGRARPYFLILDEFQNFCATPAIAKAIDQCRKRGLFILFANQHLSQISEQDIWTYHSVLQNAQIKCTFSLDDPSDLAIMEEINFVGQHDLRQTKFQAYSGEEANSPMYWSLPELRYKNQVTIANLPRRHMLLKIENEPSRVVKVAEVQDYPRDESKLRAVREIIWRSNPQYYLSEEEILAEIEDRKAALECPGDQEDDGEGYSDSKAPNFQGRKI